MEDLPWESLQNSREWENPTWDSSVDLRLETIGHSEPQRELRDLGGVSASNDGFVSIPTSKQAQRQPTVVYYTKRHWTES